MADPYLRRAFPVVPGVLISAVLFGLRHLSHLATRDASLGAVAWTVFTSACFGLAYGVFRARFGWVLPLVVLHALSDWFSILTPGYPGDLVTGTGLVLLVGTACVLLATRDKGPAPVGREHRRSDRTAVLPGIGDEGLLTSIDATSRV